MSRIDSGPYRTAMFGSDFDLFIFVGNTVSVLISGLIVSKRGFLSVNFLDGVFLFLNFLF